MNAVSAQVVGISTDADRGQGVIAGRLTCYRQELEQGTAPESWPEVELPAGLMLADVCNALGLSRDQRRDVLGDAGAVFLETVLGERISV